eukprot:6309661-Prymnesium_polylepis.1
MHGPAAMVLTTRIARKRSALTHMRAHSRGLCVTQNAMALGCKQRLKKRRTFFLLTDLPWAILHGACDRTGALPAGG